MGAARDCCFFLLITQVLTVFVCLAEGMHGIGTLMRIIRIYRFFVLILW